MIDYLFICGVGRSGTTYLRKVINDIDGVHLTFESTVLHQLFALLEEGEKLNAANLRKIAASEDPTYNPEFLSILRKKAELLPEDSSEFQWDVLIQNIFNELNPNVNTIGDKFLRIEKCETIWQRIPGAKIILLIRDPRAVYGSQLTKWSNTVEYTSYYWRGHSRKVAELKQRHPNKVHIVKYEDLVLDFDNTIGQVCQFVKGPKSEPKINLMRERNPPQPQSLTKWEGILSVRQIRRIEKICFAEMAQFGYTPRVVRRETTYPLGKVMYASSLVAKFLDRLLNRPQRLFKKQLFRRFIWLIKNS